MTYQITVDDCIAIYDQDVRAGVLVDRGRLEGAVAAPSSGFGETEFFPSLAEKAARLAYGIAEAQAYTDGNKRLAWLCTVVFLEENGTRLFMTEDYAAALIWNVSQKTCTCADLAVAFAAVLVDATPFD